MRNDLAAYCKYTTVLGRVLTESDDPSDALRPMGCAYLTAGMAGAKLRDEYVEVAGGLGAIYESVGEYALAAQCAYDALITAERETELATVAGVALWLSLADPEPDSESMEHIRADVTSTLDRIGGVLGAFRAVVDARQGKTPTDYAALAEAAGPCLGNGDQLASSAHRILAETALREGAPRVALGHITSAISTLPTDSGVWLNAPFLGVRARAHLLLGQRDEALAVAVRGWADVLAVMLWCKDDFSRQFLVGLGRDCADIAIRAACEGGDWDLLTEFIENARIQVSPAAATDAAERYNDVPTWIEDDLLGAMTQAPAAVQAMLCGEWKSNLVEQVVVTSRTSRTVADALARVDTTRRLRTFTERDCFEGLEEQVAAGAVVWSAAVRDSTLYWTLTDAHGAFDGGALHLKNAGIEPYLEDLRRVLSRRRSRQAVDVLSNLARAGSPGERLITGLFSQLIPHSLKAMALRRPDHDPLKVFFTLPAHLNVVPWPVLPLDTAEDPTRLVERIELTFLTPTAVRAIAPARGETTHPRRLAVSVCNPDRTLRAFAPVDGAVILDGAEGVVTLERFTDLMSPATMRPDDVLFVRSHLGKTSTVGHIAEQGILFGDGVLSARMLAERGGHGGPAVPMPGRVVLALCSGAGTADPAGLTLGLAAACRLSGAEEVLTSHYNVIDSEWSAELDHRLAAVAVDPAPMAAGLRRLQRECLHEWQDPRRLRTVRPDQGPAPLVWAAYGVMT